MRVPKDLKNPGSSSRITMKDVAVRAGVSQSTVSFVLNDIGEMRISDETRERVLDAVRTLGYRPRGAGRPRRASTPQSIGFLIDEVATSPFAAISIEGAQEASWKHGLTLEVAMTGGDADYEAMVLNKWSNEDFAGIIYSSILTRAVVPPPTLSKHRCVLLNCYESGEETEMHFPSVVPAERRGGEVATRALIEAGHRKIAFISGEPWMEASDQRLEGYERALRDNGLPIEPSLIVEGNFLPSGGREATLRLLSGNLKPDAIFCANDLMAVGSYEALKERGLKVGSDIAVMGYDDQEIAQHLSPALSTVLLPHREMGSWCVNYLLSSKPTQHLQRRMECPIVLRNSHLGSARSIS